MTVQDLRDKDLLIVEAIVGSRLYGTHKEGSETDIIGVYTLPNSNILSGESETVIHVKDEAAKTSAYYYELRNFLKLLKQGSPTAIELLFVPNENIIYRNEIFEQLRIEREVFITKNCKYSFGYSPYNTLNEVKLLNSLDFAQDYLDFYYVLPHNNKHIMCNFNVFNRSHEKWDDKLKPEVCVLVKTDLKDIYTLYYSTKLHYYTVYNLEVKEMPGLSLNEQNDPQPLTISEYKTLSSKEPSFRFIANIYFNKEKYIAYQKLMERKTKFQGGLYSKEKLAHAYRLMNFGIQLAKTKTINFTGDELTKSIAEGSVPISNLEIIFNNCKDRIDNLYNPITNTIESSWIKKLEVTLRSRSELLRTLNKEHVVQFE